MTSKDQITSTKTCLPAGRLKQAPNDKNQNPNKSQTADAAPLDYPRIAG
jgi:hypothetical protein